MRCEDRNLVKPDLGIRRTHGRNGLITTAHLASAPPLTHSARAADPGPIMPTILLLTLSNIFMTIAWYWHLTKSGMSKPLLGVILLSWTIAGVEYCFAVPANRIGFATGWTPGQLKIAQEAIALTVFGVFMVTVLGEALNWRHFAAFACIMAAVAFLFVGK